MDDASGAPTGKEETQGLNATILHTTFPVEHTVQVTTDSPHQFVTPNQPMSFITMATICTNVSCKQAILHLNESVNASEMTGKDASWILTSAVIIFTMQTGESFQRWVPKYNNLVQYEGLSH